MRRILVLMMLLTAFSVMVRAQLVSRSFSGTPMPQALKSIAEASDSLKVNFMYNDLEDFLVTTTIRQKSVRDAIRQVVGFYPVRIVETPQMDTITLESTSKSRRRFKGKVISASGAPLEYANVVCLSPADSTFLAGGVCNESGVFVVPCHSEEVVLKVSYVGYATQYVRTSTTDVGTISLHESVQNLAPIHISSRRLMRTADGYSINLNVRDFQTFDMLTYLPSLSVRDNTYCINGQEAETIYIDGYAIASVNELCNLPSEMVSQVKVDYKSRTISIQLRRPKSGGYYGSINAGVGVHASEHLFDRYAGGVWHARYKNFSIYDKFDFDYNDLPDRIELQASSASSLMSVVGTLHPKRTQVSNRLSLMQEFDNGHTLGMSYYVASNRLKQTSDKDSPRQVQAYFDGRNHYVDQEGTMRYTAVMGEKRNVDMNLVADVYSRATNSSALSLYGGGVGTENAESPSVLLMKFMGDVKVRLPRSLELRHALDVRYFSSLYDPDLYRYADNNADATYNNPVPNLTMPCKMRQRGTILTWSNEVNANWQRTKWSAGYDFKMNAISLNPQTHGIKMVNGRPIEDVIADIYHGSRHQFDALGLHADASYFFGSYRQHRTWVGYRHSLDDQPYSVMLPFKRWSDAYNYSIGNPELRAPRREEVNLGLSLWDNKLTAVASYHALTNEIYWQTAVSDGHTDLFYTKSINIPSTHRFDFYVETDLHLTPVWTMKMDGRVSLTPEDATIGDVHYDALSLHQIYGMANRFRFSTGWSATLMAHYEPRYSIYDRTYHATYEVSGDLSRSFFSNRLQCRLSFTPLGRRRHLDRQIGDTRLSYSYTLPVQTIGLHLVWKFSRGRSVNKHAIVDGEQKYIDIKDK